MSYTQATSATDVSQQDTRMIRYDLKCAQGHAFDAWFANSAAFDEQAERGLVACAICGCTDVEKALMVPGIAKDGARASEPAEAPAASQAPAPMLSGPVPPEVQAQLAKLRAEVEKTASNVGKNFASEARKMHVGDIEHRAIYGEATHEEAKSLVEDGVPVAPLPFVPRRDD
ncbi:MAG: DUF1178 family protein [Pseudomonadota bacterium]